MPLTSDLVPERVRVSQRQENGGRHQWNLPSARASSRPEARRESGMTVPIKDISDGRQMRSERTRQALIKAYLDLLSEMQRPPTAPEIAKRAGCSLRSVFERFSEIGGAHV